LSEKIPYIPKDFYKEVKRHVEASDRSLRVLKNT
jgi:hypothetical protein